MRFLLPLAMSLFLVLQSCQKSKVTLSSPQGLVNVEFLIQNGVPFYSVVYKNDTLVGLSQMGFDLKDAEPLSGNFSVSEVRYSQKDTVWSQPWGENKIVRDNYREMRISLGEKTGTHRLMDIVFRAYDDGAAFRYEFPKQASLDSFVIMNEKTEFTISNNPQSWWIEADFDSYEKLYRNTPMKDASWVATPITLRMNDSCYVAIHEADLTDYADMTLKQNREGTYSVELVPWANGDKVRTSAPSRTPWRVIMVAPFAAGLVENNMVLNLNEPCKIEDTSWIRPMKYIGVWWGMHLGTQTWYPGPRHGATTANAKAHIDFAAKHNIQGVVFEGWNAGWEHWGGKDAFDHITPASDFDLEGVAAYARQKGVMMIGHHETGGDIPSYEALMENAFDLCRSLGVEAVKTGYAGGIYPRGEHHHGQFMVRHYRKVVETAAKYGIMLDVHECIKPTGIRRTWPNMMTGEGVRGMEWNAWSDGNPPSHTVTLPFTRGLAGPFDYTPVTFDLLYRDCGERVKWNCDDISKTRTHSTLARQLADFVILYSPLQMASDLPENYEKHPAFKFISDYNPDIDETRVLNGEPGEFITTARRAGDEWYIGSATNEEGRTLNVSLGFLDPSANYEAQIYRDDENSHWISNPYDYVIESKTVSSTDNLVIVLAPGGGQAIRLVPVAAVK